MHRCVGMLLFTCVHQGYGAVPAVDLAVTKMGQRFLMLPRYGEMQAQQTQSESTMERMGEKEQRAKTERLMRSRYGRVAICWPLARRWGRKMRAPDERADATARPHGIAI